ncbi:Transcriptional regulator RPN4 [Colletotrichum chlorophyti]|uniref:Transcriptional regulator RPN4 n=1 Tax=Colletotrichum chlorophyti TaxID=708187 RepID=A0A1Q8RYH6_9PEZI|nr:Transcriptional regulator RPN4 [Colletotrichum chlorophyti]
MLLNRPATVQPIQHQQIYTSQTQHQPQPHYRAQQQHQFYSQSLDFDLDNTSFEDPSRDLNSSSISSSPLSTQSLLPNYTFATQPTTFNFDSSQLAVPRRSAPASTAFDDFSLDFSSNNNQQDLMQSDASWVLGNQYAPKSFGRLPHQRESSLSSLGSAGPASPFNHNTSNPQIAVTDSLPDGLPDMQASDNTCYQLSKTVPTTHDNVYPNYNGLANIPTDMSGYASAFAIQKPRSDRGLLPAPELSMAGNRSHPASVASSIAGDSPVTPSTHEQEEDRRRKAAFNSIPKLDRTMTDVYNDELYNPNFTITSASPAQSQMAASPSNEVFAQRLHAANNQHLSAAQSPVSSVSRDRSPFRQGSPLAPTSSHDFASAHMKFNSAQHMREQKKAERDAQIMRQQMSMKSEPETPKTISPKDAMLEFHDAEADSSYSLFPSQDSSDFDEIAKAVALPEQHNGFARSVLPNENAFSYMSAANGVQVPQQYPFIAVPRQSQEQPQRFSSAESTSSVSEGSSISNNVPMTKPAGAAADGGTYTCTYHGCTMRFETPALLQKHKREGHRQTQGITGPRRGDGGNSTADSLLNSQAGPHRCDRINPSTGKPCHTVFSRPYDLTRHEDTIHNARKQKVRCNLCTEEKTFSRADALTRHYRVCHPDVEFQGKHRRRGHNA